MGWVNMIINKYKPDSQVKNVKPPAERRCTLCSSVVGKGRTHKCTKQQMRENLHKLVAQKSMKSKEKIASNVIKHIFEDKGVNKRGGTVLLSTGGDKLPVTLSFKVNKVRFSHENLKRLQVVQGSSDRGIKKTAQAIRHILGRDSIAPGLAASLSERNKLLENHFEVKEFTMKKKPKDDEKGDFEVDDEGYMDYKVNGVVTPNFDKLVREITELRGLNPGETEVLCGLDDGQEFNKIGFVIISKAEESIGVNVMCISNYVLLIFIGIFQEEAFWQYSAVRA